jgi:hypothetical protein
MSSRYLPLTGVVFFALLVVTSVMSGSTPQGKASGAKVLAFYHAHRTRDAVSAALVGLAILVGLFFYRCLRDHLRRASGSDLLAGVAFGGALLFAAAGGLSSGAQYALSIDANHLSAAAAQAVNLMATDAAFLLQGAGIAVLLIASGLAILRGGELPSWTGWFALVFGVVALVPPLAFAGFIGAGVWTLVVSLILYSRGTVSAPAAGSLSGA